ncbi:putative pili assembly chaperone [Burkholderiales bacterium 8X]|nr:putative pili assembly chaperone [Burkholderiales bacterium 8X]
MPRTSGAIRGWLPFVLALAMLSGLAGLARAAGLNVAPVRLNLSAERTTAALTLGNADEEEVGIQVEVMRWRQEDGRDLFEPTRDLVVNPGIFKVAGKGRQIVRVGFQGKPGEVEGSYRVFLQQLPRAAQDADGGTGVRLQTLLRISIPIFVPPVTEARSDLSWRLVAASGKSPGGSRELSLQVVNRGNEHLQLTQVVVRRPDGTELARSPMSRYVLPGASLAWPLQLPPLPPDAPLTIEVTSDARSPLPPIAVRTPHVGPAAD